MIVVDENRCKGCALCTTVCPKDIIVLADYFTPRGYRPAKLLATPQSCTGCLLSRAGPRQKSCRARGWMSKRTNGTRNTQHIRNASCKTRNIHDP
jgi:2-oxoglutarate ferredoxin oxidoreductase subunit delta